MKLCLPLGVSAVEFSATAGEQIKVAALNGDRYVDKYLTANLSKAPNRKDKWIASVIAIASQARDPHVELEAVLAHCAGIVAGRCDTRTSEMRLIDQVLEQNSEIQRLRLELHAKVVGDGRQTESL